MKPLDMADKYPPADEDDEPTVKMQVPDFHPQVIVEEEGNVYPGVGLLLSIGVGLLFWGTLAWLIWR